MAFLRLLLYGGFIFIITTAISPDENTKNSSITSYNCYLKYIQPKHYDIKFTPYFKEIKEKDDIYITFKTDIEKYRANGRFILYGEINAIIHILQPTTKICLSSSNSIRHLSGELIQKNGDNIRPEEYYLYLVEKIEYDNVTQTYVLHFKKELLRAHYTLNIKFLNAINISGDDNIFLKTTYVRKPGNEKWWQTHFPTTGVQRLFPCWDDPSIRTTFNVSIKHHCNYSVFSNMPKRQEEIFKYKLNNAEICMQWTYFDITPSIPAHLVIVTILSIHFFPSPDIDRIHIWRNPNLEYIQFAERISSKVIRKLKFEWFKLRKVKIPKLQLIAIPGFRNDINMNFGLVAMRETSIIYNENVHSIAHKIEVARLIARGISYQWFSHLIIPTSWSDLWLKDGLTTLFGMDALDSVNALENYKNSEILDLFIVQTQYESLQLDDYNLTQALISEISNPPEINSLSSYSRYIKAPLILRMLQHLVTKEVFWKSARQYLIWHTFEWTTPADFWLLMQLGVYESLGCSKAAYVLTPNKHLINDWAKYVNYPTLKIIRKYNEKKMLITIKNYYDFCENDHLLIPVTFTTESNLNFASPLDNERLIIIKSPLGDHVDIVEDGWVMFNLQQSGYYRVNYDSENWQKIAKYLNSREYTKVHVLNRAKIIDDAFHFMITQQLDSSIFWNLTSYLARETNYIAWYPMIKAFEYMSNIFPFIDESVNDIKIKLNKILRSLLSKLKYRESAVEDEFTKCLRQEAIKWACILGDITCQRIAYNRLLHHIENPEKITNYRYYRFLPWWEEWIYCKGLTLADFDTWQMMKNMALTQNHNNRFLEFLACSKNNINEYLKLITPQDNGSYIEIQADKCTNSFLFIIAKHAKNDTVLKNILTNFEKLKPKDISDLAAFTIIINHVYFKNQLDEIKNAAINIIEKKAYVSITDILYQKNKIQEANILTNYIMNKSRVEYWKWCIERKLEIRLSEIEKHRGYLRKFSEDGLE